MINVSKELYLNLSLDWVRTARGSVTRVGRIWDYSLWLETTLVALRAVLNLLQLGDSTLLINEDVHEYVAHECVAHE